jgi:Uma2 family endonuclease
MAMKAAAETIAKPVPLRKYRFTVEQYRRMGEMGLFAAAQRVELIHGEIVEINPIKSPHADCVDKLAEWLIIHFHQQAIVRIQNPITLDDHSEPEPDLVLAKRKPGGYRLAHPAPAEVILIIEVADSSADKDRHIKLPLYAAAGIPEAWLVDLNELAVEVHTQPSAQGYSSIHIFRLGDVLRTLTVAGLAVEDILG